MARKAVGSGLTKGPQSGANRRDAQKIAAINTPKYNSLMWPSDASIDAGTKDCTCKHRREVHRINVEASITVLLADFAGAMMSVLYGDFVAPGMGTAQRLKYLADVALAISREREGADKRTFLGIKKSLEVAQHAVKSHILLDAPPANIVLRLSDLVLSLAERHKLDMTGMMPKMHGTSLPTRG